MKDITLSVVSHNQAKLVEKLFRSLSDINFKGKIICTINAENEYFNNIYGLDILFQRNINPKGFGENHNNAFNFCLTKYFVVINPDVILNNDVFAPLICSLKKKSRIGVITTGSRNTSGILQDNARKFPTIRSLTLKLLGFKSFIDYSNSKGLIESDWISGQFMLFKSSIFSNLGGFSSKYYMYYEDVDICRRLHSLGYSVVIDTNLFITHDAQRASHVNFSMFKIHVSSAIKYFFS